MLCFGYRSQSLSPRTVTWLALFSFSSAPCFENQDRNRTKSETRGRGVSVGTRKVVTKWKGKSGAKGECNNWPKLMMMQRTKKGMQVNGFKFQTFTSGSLSLLLRPLLNSPSFTLFSCSVYNLFSGQRKRFHSHSYSLYLRFHWLLAWFFFLFSRKSWFSSSDSCLWKISVWLTRPAEQSHHEKKGEQFSSFLWNRSRPSVPWENYHSISVVGLHRWTVCSS